MNRKLIVACAIGAVTFLKAELNAADLSDTKPWMLNANAWKAYKMDNYADAQIYVKKCLELHEAKAKQQQNSLTAMPVQNIARFDVLNKVAGCLIIQAKIYEKQSKDDEAIKTYLRVIEEFYYAQAKGKKGVWDLAGQAQKAIEKMTGVSF